MKLVLGAEMVAGTGGFEDECLPLRGKAFLPKCDLKKGRDSLSEGGKRRREGGVKRSKIGSSSSSSRRDDCTTQKAGFNFDIEREGLNAEEQQNCRNEGRAHF